jgi:DNA-binding transcriptional regulator YdaS (Cro superfamily)
MKLQFYLFLKEIPIKEFGKKIGVHHAYLSRISNGHVAPSWRLAKDIEQATDGYVTIQELMNMKFNKISPEFLESCENHQTAV